MCSFGVLRILTVSAGIWLPSVLTGPRGLEAAFLQRLTKVDAAIDDLKAEGLMGVDRHLIVDPGVGGDLKAALFAGPLFGGAHQGGTDSLFARCFVDEPAFNEAYGMGGVASVGVGAEGDFDKAG